MSRQPQGRAPVAITHRVRHDLRRENIGALSAALQPGDLVLSAGTSLVAWAIVRWQRDCGLPSPACDFSHVAMGTGAGQVVHALPGRGVVAEDFAAVFAGANIVLLRPRPVAGAVDDRPARVAQAALAQVGTDYALDALRIAVAQRLFGQPDLAAVAGKLTHGWLCSTLVTEAYLEVFRGATPLETPGLRSTSPFVTPGDIFVQPGLTDVPVGGMVRRAERG